MWEQYRKTFWRVQITIWIIAIAVYFLTHGNWRNALLFWVVMQISALIGANWANRMNRFVNRDSASTLPRNQSRRGL